MQAQNSAEGKKTKKGGQYPAPPARSKAGRVGITKELVDLLLEHDVPSLRSPIPASY
jgi:hypothetical protein